MIQSVHSQLFKVHARLSSHHHKISNSHNSHHKPQHHNHSHDPPTPHLHPCPCALRRINQRVSHLLRVPTTAYDLIFNLPHILRILPLHIPRRIVFANKIPPRRIPTTNTIAINSSTPAQIPSSVQLFPRRIDNLTPHSSCHSKPTASNVPSPH